VLAALLAIAASGSWGVSNFVAGLESRRRSVWTVTAVSQIASALSAVVLLLFASGETLTTWNAVWAVVAGLCGATGIVALYRALALGAMSVVSPIIAAQVVVPVTVGLVLGERPGAVAWAGIVLAAGGVALVSRGGGSRAARVPRAAVVLAVLTAALFGVMGLALDQCGDGSPLRSVVIVRVVSAGVILLYFFASRRRLDLGARDLPALAGVGVLLTAANALLTAAFTLGLLTIISVLGSLSPVVTTGLAQVVLHERLSSRQWAGVVAVFAGVVLLSL
jgi:drug/metabolite transporter (DMT)-like permease